MTSTLTPSPQPSLTRFGQPELSSAAGVLRRHADNPSAFLALNADTEHFQVTGIDGLIAYRAAGRRHLVQLGGVFAAPEDQDRLLRAFLAAAAQNSRRVVSVQLNRADAERYAAHGFTVNQFGASYARSLASFTLKGGAHMRLRNKLSRARRMGVEVSEVGVDRPASPGLDAQLSSLDQIWLRAKGRHVKELAFLVGERGGPAAALRRLFLAHSDDRLIGYISYSPVYGSRPGWLHDLSRRLPDAPPGAMELVVLTSIERFRAESAEYLHFGLTPFTGLDPRHEIASAGSTTAARVVRLLAERGQAIYPAADQLAYKEKWGPDVVLPEYVAFQRGVRPAAVWQLLRLTRAM